MSHLCHRPTCQVQVPPKLLACRPHWFQLPKHIRARIWATYRPGQENDKRPSPAYLAVVKEALAFWEALAGDDVGAK